MIPSASVAYCWCCFPWLTCFVASTQNTECSVLSWGVIDIILPLTPTLAFCLLWEKESIRKAGLPSEADSQGTGRVQYGNTLLILPLLLYCWPAAPCSMRLGAWRPAVLVRIAAVSVERSEQESGLLRSRPSPSGKGLLVRPLCEQQLGICPSTLVQRNPPLPA